MVVLIYCCVLTKLCTWYFIKFCAGAVLQVLFFNNKALADSGQTEGVLHLMAQDISRLQSTLQLQQSAYRYTVHQLPLILIIIYFMLHKHSICNFFFWTLWPDKLSYIFFTAEPSSICMSQIGLCTMCKGVFLCITTLTLLIGSNDTVAVPSYRFPCYSLNSCHEITKGQT